MSAPGKKERPWFNYLGFAILAACYCGALWNVYTVKKDEVLEGKKVIRLCHWQLELGYQKAMQALIDKFEKKYPDVKIVQIPVSERSYGQFVTTQLIGRTAPDLIEMGFFNVKEGTPRYFTPLTEILRKPNPFNADNPKLAKTPWMDTFSDGLQSCYVPELVDYYKVGFNTFTVRIFYNKTLFKRILGKDAPPRNLEEFFDYCERVKAYERKWNERVAKYNASHPDTRKTRIVLDPIASAKYQMGIFKSRYNVIFGFDRYLAFDEDCDGKVEDAELFAGILGGDRIVDDVKYRATNELLKRMTAYFPRGFMSLGRMDSGFAFVQSRAAMITSGSWDASSYVKQAADQPFGDVIVKINGENVSTAESAAEKLMAAAGNTDITLLVDSGGMTRSAHLKPNESGRNLFERYGMELENIKRKNGGTAAVVSLVDSASPASRAGLNARKAFEVGVFDFPMPLKSDPKYGKYVVGKVAELASTAGAFGLCKFSKHKDVAIKFLQFCTTPENNELFNEICQWMPVVKGAKIPKALIPFKPHPDGYYGALGFRKLQRTGTVEEQTFWPFISERKIDYDWFERTMLSKMPPSLSRDYVTCVRNVSELVPDKMVRRSAFLADTIFADDSDKAMKTAKLAAIWDVLWLSMTEINRFNALIDPYEAKADDNDFNKKFFDNLKRRR